MARYLVTGVSRGVGRAVAQRLAADGHQVHGLVRSAGGAAAPELAGLELAGLVELELTALPDFETVLAGWLATVDRLDGLVHCAGIVRAGLLADADSGDFTEQFAVNVVAAAELTRLCLPALRAASGTVVFLNSGSGLNARPPLSAYGVSKFALRGYAEALRQEEPDVRVSTIYPGRIATDMQRQVRAAESGHYDEDAYLRPATVAGVIASVLSLPADATVTDLTVRPASQPGPSSPDAHR